MNTISRYRFKNASAAALALTLLLGASACKKKAPAPPPAPPPPSSTAPTPAPEKPSLTFTVEPTSIQKGQSAMLRWQVSNATDMSIDQGVGAVQSSGQRQVYPNDTTTYTLTAKGPGGSDSKSVTVDVSTPPPPPAPAAVQESAIDIVTKQVQDAYFDYDKSDIRDDARAVLTTDADPLKKVFSMDSNVVVTVEGHCDERGSAEYNLALGDRRSAAAKEFLTQLGVPGDRLKTISYGKEKPVCTDANESCYQRNRHAHFTAGQ